MLAVWNEATGFELGPAASENVLHHLRLCASHPNSLCLVAEDAHSVAPAGFVTALISTHPTLPGMLGEIEELYVRAPARRSGVGTTLVRHAIAAMRDRSVGLVRTRVDLDSRDALGFWKTVGWDHDFAVFSLYLTEELPGTPTPARQRADGG